MQNSQYEYDLDITIPSAPAKLVSKIQSGSRVLEVGTAAGSMTKYLSQKLNCRVTGLEKVSDWANRAKPFCEQIVIQDLDSDWSVEDLGNDFDYVVCADVLEHLLDPAGNLLKLSRCLKPGGEILMTFPNISYLGVVAAIYCGQFPYTKTGILDETHLRFFTQDSMASMIHGIGLSISSMEPIMLPVEFSEFASYLAYLPDSIKSQWMMLPHALAYQYLFIVKT